MDLRVAIHDSPGSFSDRWIEYCREHGVAFKEVDGQSSDIITRLAEFDLFLWQWSHVNAEDAYAARRVLRAAEAIGKRVFPDAATCWHYDDKVAQKYLLEGIGAPLVPSYVLYSLEQALDWIERAEFPKVFKLSTGAGSQNVRLARTKSQARRLARRAFGKGFKAAASPLADIRRRVRGRRQAGDVMAAVRRLPRSFWRTLTRWRIHPHERGYIYLQDFVPDNLFDTRITVIGDRAFGYRRAVRPGDFRASGSGQIDYDPKAIDERCVKIAFTVAQRIGTQSLAFDFVRLPSGEPKIVEISYCYLPHLVHTCSGHWRRDGRWVDGHVWPQDAILEDLLSLGNGK